MSERIGNLSYLAIGKQTDPHTAVTPSNYVPFWKESFTTNGNSIESNPAYGSRFEVFQVLQGQRDHSGAITVTAEPNTIASFFDMELTKSSTTGSGPYTHVFGLSNLTDPHPYTFDISLGSHVKRIFGVQASAITPTWNDNEMRLEVSGAGLHSYMGRKIASVSTSTLTLSTEYDPRPTLGLVENDLMRIFKADGTMLDHTIVSLTDTTVTLNSAPSGVAAGDILHLRPATVSFDLLTPFLWSNTEFRYGADATAALAAAHTPLEAGSNWSIMNSFEDDAGSKRSGSFDPASLVRTTARYELTDKRHYDKSDQEAKRQSLEKVACVVRHFAGAARQYELRLTFNHMKVDNPIPPVEAGSVMYSEQVYKQQYDQIDGKGLEVTVINNRATV
jgi:hypothetical protein